MSRKGLLAIASSFGRVIGNSAEIRTNDEEPGARSAPYEPSTHSAPPGQCSFFQIGARFLSSSIK